METLIVFAVAVICVVYVFRFLKKLENQADIRDTVWAAEREADRIKQEKMYEYERKLKTVDSLRSISRSYMEYLARR